MPGSGRGVQGRRRGTVRPRGCTQRLSISHLTHTQHAQRRTLHGKIKRKRPRSAYSLEQGCGSLHLILQCRVEATCCALTACLRTHTAMSLSEPHSAKRRRRKQSQATPQDVGGDRTREGGGYLGCSR
eukprot:3313843-Rhodomonas_salina.2